MMLGIVSKHGLFGTIGLGAVSCKTGTSSPSPFSGCLHSSSCDDRRLMAWRPPTNGHTITTPRSAGEVLRRENPDPVLASSAVPLGLCAFSNPGSPFFLSHFLWWAISAML